MPEQCPLYASSVAAGFPSPAEDLVEQELNLHQLLVSKPLATFFLRVSGDSMREAGIFHDDILVVEKTSAVAHGQIVVAAINGELLVKYYHSRPCRQFVAANPSYAPIRLDEFGDYCIWGVVKACIHRFGA